VFLQVFHETHVTTSSFVRLLKSNCNKLLKLQQTMQQKIYALLLPLFTQKNPAMPILTPEREACQQQTQFLQFTLGNFSITAQLQLCSPYLHKISVELCSRSKRADLGLTKLSRGPKRKASKASPDHASVGPGPSGGSPSGGGGTAMLGQYSA